MKSLLKLTSLGIAALGLNLVPVHAVQLSLGTDGVTIDTGGEKFLLQKPTLQKAAGGGVSSTMTLSDDGKSLVEKFTGGMTLTISIEADGKTIDYKCADSAEGYKGFGVNMAIPVSYANGAKYAFDEAKLTNFPGEKGKLDYVDRGDHEMFKLLPISGTGFSLKMPRSWHKLQDNRFYNNGTTFEEQYIYIFATYSGTTSFSIVVDDLPQPAPPASNPVNSERRILRRLSGMGEEEPIDTEAFRSRMPGCNIRT